MCFPSFDFLSIAKPMLVLHLMTDISRKPAGSGSPPLFPINAMLAGYMALIHAKSFDACSFGQGREINQHSKSWKWGTAP